MIVTRNLLESPGKIVAFFIAAQIIFWTLIPTWLHPNAPLDVIEGYVWGHAWQWGFYKHPPLQSWLLEIGAILTNRAAFSHFAISQLCIAVCLWFIWRLARRTLTPEKSMAAVLLLSGIIYYHFTSIEFNPNVVLIPLWAAAGFFFVRATEDGKKRDWFYLGLMLGIGLYGKYFILLLGAVLCLYLLADKASRRHWLTLGPYITFLTFAIVSAPHLWWLIEHDWASLSYAESRTHGAEDLSQHLLFPMKFLGAQILDCLAALLIFFLLVADRKKLSIRNIDLLGKNKLLTWLTFAPLVLLLLMSALTGMKMKDMWGTPLFCFLGLWLLHAFPCQEPLKRLRFLIATVAAFLLGLFIFVAITYGGPFFTHKGKRAHFPGAALAAYIEKTWQVRRGEPLSYVIGDTWLAGNIAYYAKDRPDVLMSGDYNITPWIKPADVMTKGGILVWCQDQCRNEEAAMTIPPHLAEKFPNAWRQPPLTLPWQTDADIPQAIIGWAIINPAPVDIP
jgi:4-amino-4-deoxy-L-arabinose transferase-like glycosyltransferase